MAQKPGAGTIGTVEYIRSARLLDNPALSRMPTTQQEWNGFIIELNKWLRHETYAWIPTFTGFSADPTDGAAGSPIVQYQLFGEVVLLNFDLVATGTSDATDFTISNLPSIITPKIEQIYPMSGLWDNGAVTAGTIKIQTDGTLVFTVGTTGAGGNWTGSSTKGFDGRANAVVYTLHSPAESLATGGPL